MADTQQSERETYRWDDEDVLADPYPTYARLHASAPVREEPSHGAWHVAGYEQVLAAIKDETALRAQIDRSNFLTRWPEAYDEAVIVRKFFDSWMLFKDPPHHTRIRSLIHRLYSRSHVRRFRPDIERTVGELLDAAAKREEIDVVRDYAVPVSRVALAKLLGASEDDLAEAVRWSDEIAGYMNTEATAETVCRVAPVILELKRFAIEFCTRGDLPEDSVAAALGRAYERGVLDENELAATLTQNITGALAALAQFLAHAVLRLLEHPSELERLRDDPSLTGNAVEELLRYDCPFLLIVRQATRDIDLDDVTIPRDAFVGLLIGAANRDPHRFPDPDRLDIGRENVQHLAFGYGGHYCLGAALSREVGEVAIRALVERFPNMQPVDGAERVPSFGIRWLKTLPITLEGRPAMAETVSRGEDGALVALSDVERLVAGFVTDLARRRDEMRSELEKIDQLIAELEARYPSVESRPAVAEAAGDGSSARTESREPTAYRPRRATAA
ncbi:MAG: cytochrome P450, partial [Actinomycetota bacterium]|nr:cytochrome P450 [Actinomycetota bacterium]